MVHLLHSHIIFRDYVKEAALDLVRAFTPHINLGFYNPSILPSPPLLSLLQTAGGRQGVS